MTNGVTNDPTKSAAIRQTPNFRFLTCAYMTNVPMTMNCSRHDMYQPAIKHCGTAIRENVNDVFPTVERERRVGRKYDRRVTITVLRMETRRIASTGVRQRGLYRGGLTANRCKDVSRRNKRRSIRSLVLFAQFHSENKRTCRSIICIAVTVAGISFRRAFRC